MLELWYEALNSTYGIVVETDDFKLASTKLYRAREKANDPALMGLSIVRSPESPAHFWIVKREPNRAG